MDSKEASVNDLVVTYGIAVVAVITACSIGAYVLAGAIAMFTGNMADMPSIFGILGSGGVIDLMVAGGIAVVAGVIAHLALKKVASSPNAGAMVATDNYALINKTAKAGCFIGAGLAGVAAVAVLLGALLSINRYTPWGSYFLGDIMPLLFTGAGLVAAGVLIGKFVKAEVKANVLSMVAMVIAIAGIALACIAVLVRSHISTSSSTETFLRNSIYNVLND
ncbi:MAG: hypothetical protein Q4C83_02345 [Candidatus Saccharibacteria bacterium]|nr:hypothetical protein [Candidatus Saccharibacteria bacterium]